MTWDGSIRRRRDSALVAATVGASLVALALLASLSQRQWLLAGLAGAAGFALWRRAMLGKWRSPALFFDALAFGIFAIQRNDDLAFWQLVGPWADVFRFNVAGAAISYAAYITGSLFVLATAYRAPRP